MSIMKIITGDEYNEILQLYKYSFVKNDQCTGNNYMWERLIKYNRRSEQFCYKYLENMKEIYVTWDTLENVIIYDPDYWKYPPESILKIQVHEFFELLPTFPEDIYIFDETLEWTIVLTHEDVFDKKRYCLMIP